MSKKEITEDDILLMAAKLEKYSKELKEISNQMKKVKLGPTLIYKSAIPPYSDQPQNMKDQPG